MTAYVNDLKAAPCVDCGGRFPAVAMDFDHISGTKLIGISELRHYNSLARLQRELEKCEVVCANCHRVRTAARERPWGWQRQED